MGSAGKSSVCLSVGLALTPLVRPPEALGMEVPMSLPPACRATQP